MINDGSRRLAFDLVGAMADSETQCFGAFLQPCDAGSGAGLGGLLGVEICLLLE
jgi:hypothetical protein